MNIYFKKVFADLKENLSRSILIIIAVMIGTISVCATFSAKTVLSREIDMSFKSSYPASIILWLNDIKPDLLKEVSKYPGVVSAEPRRLIRSRAEVAPGDWRTLLIFVVDDFDNLKVSTFFPVSGDKTPKDGEILIEQSALPVLKVLQGDKLHIRVPGGKFFNIKVGGITHDPGLAPGWQDNEGYGYITKKTLALLSQDIYLDELKIYTGNLSREQSSVVATNLSESLFKKGYEINRVEIPLNEHPHADHMQTMVFILQTFSILALILSGTLAANVISSLLSRQTKQIGVMKAIGGKSYQIALIYLALILILSLIAVIIGLPIGSKLSDLFVNFAAKQLNLEVKDWSVPLWMYGLYALLGIGIPIIASSIPVIKAMKMTVIDSIQYVGQSTKLNNRLLINNWLSCSMSLSLRNTFRKPIRLILTICALGLGGALLMTAVNIYTSLIYTVDKSLAARKYNIEIGLLKPVSSQKIIKNIEEIEGVKKAEAWGMVLANIKFKNIKSEQVISSSRYPLLSPPNNTEFFNYKIVQGNSLKSSEKGIIINRTLQDNENNLEVGSEITLIFAGKKIPVKIIGLTEEIGEPVIYTNSLTFKSLTGISDKAGAIRIRADENKQLEISTKLEQTIVDSGGFPVLMMTNQSLRKAMTDHFMIILVLLSLLSFSAIIIGGLGLATSMGLNVLERTREIGIIRAIGATPFKVIKIIMTEGLALMICSVFLAIIFSLPVSKAISIIVGKHGLHSYLTLLISLKAILGWIIIALVITFIACIIPSIKAIKLSVKDVIAYE